MTEDAKMLAAALLWLRNHYEVGAPDLKDRVIERIDRVLKWREPTGEDMRRFREMYLAEVVIKDTGET